ncbi:MAG: PEFG-CTERM sorting domain-containing protein [Candidatus Thioglobus sp.]|nr:PEFG-CTERM sorting domain-containing protein [Candidatus Thioglobus sp.]
MKYTIASLSIVLLAVTIMSVSALGQNAYAAHDLQGAEGSGLSLTAECSGSSCDISGTSDRSDLDVTIKLSNSKGIHSIAQASVSGDSYSASFNVSDLSDGAYTITATQSVSGQTTSKYSIPVDIDVSDGTSTSSVSVNNRTSHDEGTYVSSENIPTTESLKKLTLTADGIQGSTTINVSGTTDRSDEIIIKVLAPNGNIIAIAQITPTGGSFATTIGVGGPLWSQDGTYTITATQTSNGLNSSTETFNRAVDVTGGGLANYQNSAEVEILDGHVVPEFGVIAAMILAVAIVSIIVVTAKTRLTIVPRY